MTQLFIFVRPWSQPLCLPSLYLRFFCFGLLCFDTRRLIITTLRSPSFLCFDFGTTNFGRPVHPSLLTDFIFTVGLLVERVPPTCLRLVRLRCILLHDAAVRSFVTASGHRGPQLSRHSLSDFHWRELQGHCIFADYRRTPRWRQCSRQTELGVRTRTLLTVPAWRLRRPRSRNRSSRQQRSKAECGRFC